MGYLQAFSENEQVLVKRWLATRVASMMGRKLEEGDWSHVYCKAKGIPEGGWSNLHIDINHDGLGLELKLLRVSGLRDKPIKSVCGTTLMHPAATRSIRIEDATLDATEVMRDVFQQYGNLIDDRARLVQEKTPSKTPDMRTGWLLWEDHLTEFLYFEEEMFKPDPDNFIAEWNITPPRGARKASKSLWIFERESKKKRYSVTTSAGIKIQPYFDVPSPSHPHLNYFRVQSEQINDDIVRLWISAATARALRDKLGTLDVDVVSEAIIDSVKRVGAVEAPEEGDGLAVALDIRASAHEVISSAWEAVSDEHRAQLLLSALS